MQIICKKRLNFQDFEITINPRSNEKVAKVVRTLTVSPSTRPQQIDDWVRQDDLFDLSLADGSLMVIGECPEKLPKPHIEEPSQSIAQSMQPTAELTEADLELLNRPISELTGQPAPVQYPTRPDGFPRPDEAR